MVKQCNFPEPKVCFIQSTAQKSQTIQFIIIYYKEKHQIITLTNHETGIFTKNY